MKTINIDKIIEGAGLDKNVVAMQLFPQNSHPRLALNRVSVTGNLDADQISKLATMAGRPISEIFSPKEWKASRKADELIFTNGRWTARYNTETGMTDLWHNNSLIHETIIHKKAISLDDYLRSLELIISKKHEN